MAKTKKKPKIQSVISVKALSEKSGIAHHRVYSYFKGVYKSLSLEEKKQLAITLHDESLPLMKELGFYFKIHPIKDQDQP